MKASVSKKSLRLPVLVVMLFISGLSRSQGQDAYFQSRQQMNSEAAEFLAGDSAAEGVEDVDIEPIGEITDGEETLGMESCVSGETEDVRHYSEEELDAIGFDDENLEIAHLDEYHDYLRSTRDLGSSFDGYHEWHMGSYGNFGIN